jgi:hypothetical protein
MTRFCQDHIVIYTINILMMKISIFEESFYRVVGVSIGNDRLTSPHSLLTDSSAQPPIEENCCFTVGFGGFGIAE